MKLILTRHGETNDNLNKIIQGHNPGELSKLGILQANKVARRLKSEKINYILSSDLARASDTTKIIAKLQENVTIKFTKDLRERYMGKLQGKNIPDKWSERKYDFEFNNEYDGERWDQLYERAKLFVKTVLPKFKGKTVLIVGHNQINQAIILNLLDEPWENVKDMKKMGNTSITEFEFDDNFVPLKKIFDCTDHLEDYI